MYDDYSHNGYRGGYSGYSMSNRAEEAYADGEKPLSKWTKQDLLEAFNDEDDAIEDKKLIKNDVVERAKKLTKSELADLILEKTSWHHTSSMYNKTDFYSINYDKAYDLTIAEIDSIINNRVKYEKCKNVVEKPTYITSLVSYSEWEGSRNKGEYVYKKEIVNYMSNEKMVKCRLSNTYSKRLSSLLELCSIEQKTKFATNEAVIDKFAKEKKEIEKRQKQQLAKEKKKNLFLEKLYQKIEKILNCEDIARSRSGNYYAIGTKPNSEEVDDGLLRVRINEDNEPILQIYHNGWNDTGENFSQVISQSNEIDSNFKLSEEELIALTYEQCKSKLNAEISAERNEKTQEKQLQVEQVKQDEQVKQVRQVQQVAFSK